MFQKLKGLELFGETPEEICNTMVENHYSRKKVQVFLTENIDLAFWNRRCHKTVTPEVSCR
jgi:hypothetical protein